MPNYALVINNEFIEVRNYAEKPEDIPHKNVTWYEVQRGVGEAFTGLRDGKWMIISADPATLPPVVPTSITPRQCRLILAMQGLLPQVEAMIAQQDEATKITWEYALEFRRDDPLLTQLTTNLTPPLSAEQIDAFFIAAAKL